MNSEQEYEIFEHNSVLETDKTEVALFEISDLDEYYPKLEAIYEEGICQLENILRLAEQNFENKIVMYRDQIPEEDYKKVIDDVNRILLKEQTNINYKVFMIKKVTETRIRELRTVVKILDNRLNDWIILFVKRDNNYIYKYIAQIKQFINKHELIDIKMF